MKIDNVAFNLTSEDLANFGLKLTGDNDASGNLTIGDDVESVDKSVQKHISENELATWDAVIALLESAGTQVKKSTSSPRDDTTYLCFGKSELAGIIKLGIPSELYDVGTIGATELRELMPKWPTLAFMMQGEDYYAYNSTKFSESRKNRKKVPVTEANDRIGETISAARLMTLNDAADERLGKISNDFLTGPVDSNDISFLISARKSFDAGVAKYIGSIQ